MQPDKIEDNPSNRKAKRDIEGLQALSKAYPIFRMLGLVRGDISEEVAKLPSMAEQQKDLSQLPDRFNAHFALRGWIAYGWLNVEVMKRAILLADEGNVSEAELLLIDSYDEANLRMLLKLFSAYEPLRIRKPLAERALEEYLLERYETCIPLLLMIMDGIVNDISVKTGRNLGFFAAGVDLNAFDSITGHPTGLLALGKLFGSPRERTTTDPIDIPYRNGILHGRDLGYANKAVAAKAWAALWAIRDWALDVRNGKRDAPPEEKPPTFKESVQGLADSFQLIADLEAQRRLLEAWTPRSLVVGVDCPAAGLPDEYAPGTPERTVAEFMHYWSKKNYGNMGRLLDRIVYQSVGVVAKEIRKWFETKELISFDILRIEDTGACATNVYVRTEVRSDDTVGQREDCLRLLYEDGKGDPALLPREDAAWRITSLSLDPIAYGIYL